MRYLKTFILAFSTLCCIALGAALPYLALRIQEPQVGELWRRAELSTVDLTLRQEGDVVPALRMMSKKCTESVWEGDTRLKKEDACRAALEAIKNMGTKGLLSKEEGERLENAAGNVKPHLLVAEDGSPALFWMCTWEGEHGTFVTLDDATGKAVRVLADSAVLEPTDGAPSVQTESWGEFCQEYYGAELTKIEPDMYPDENSTRPVTVLHFTSRYGTPFDISLDLWDGWIYLNYW